MHRIARPFLLLAALALPVLALAIPQGWQEGDFPREPRKWYSVKVASLPKGSPLAASFEQGLRNSGWGPVSTTESGGTLSVMVGRTNRVGDALYLMGELRERNIAEGEVVVVPPPADGKVAMVGDFQPPFVTDAFEFKRSEDEMRTRIRSLVSGFPEDEQAPLLEGLKLWEAKQFSDPRLAAGLVPVASFLWNQKTDTDIVEFIASHVAPGEAPGLWVTTNEQNAIRVQARRLMFECMATKDWRGAWKAAQVLEKEDLSGPESKARNIMRQAIMLVDAPGSYHVDFADIREYLRRAWDAAPADSKRLRARIEAVYMLTFAWEGKWARVDKLSTDIIAKNDGDAYALAMGRIYHAVSKTRFHMYDEALQELDEVIFGTTISEADRPRRGTESLDPVELAKSWRETIRKRSGESGAVSVEPVIASTPVASGGTAGK